MDKPALVFLCQRIPYPPNKGERITSFNLLRHLTAKYRVYLGTFVDDPQDLDGVAHLQTLVAGLHYDVLHKPWAFVPAIARWLMGEPLSYALFRSAALRRWLRRVESEHRPVAIVTHSSNISGYAVDGFQRPAGQGPRRILHFADVDSEKFRAYAQEARGPMRWLMEIEWRRVRREERRLANIADIVAFVSDEESQLFRCAVDGRTDNIVTLPNGTDLELFDPDREYPAPFLERGPHFVFTGAMDYPPNIHAVVWFANKVLPLIQARLPESQFFIVGTRPAEAVHELARLPGVVVTGRVDSVVPYLAYADVAVAPLHIARGIQNKVLEAMAMRKPLVVSIGAMTGLNVEVGKHLLCADTPAEWADCCIRLATDKQVAGALGAAAREHVCSRFTWAGQLAKLDALLESR